jgi:hypothetical protein
MSKARATRRLSENMLPLYPADASRGWRVIRQVPFAKGSEKVAAGEWALLCHTDGTPWYFQIIANFKADADLPASEPTRPITAHESALNAGLFGQSRTAGMPEDVRLSRHDRYDTDRPLPPEDAVERAMAKTRVWPKVGEAKGDILKAWPR